MDRSKTKDQNKERDECWFDFVHSVFTFSCLHHHLSHQLVSMKSLLYFCLQLSVFSYLFSLFLRLQVEKHLILIYKYIIDSEKQDKMFTNLQLEIILDTKLANLIFFDKIEST